MTKVSSKDIIKAILTNPNYDEEEKSTLVEELLQELKREYPELKHHATKADVKEVEKQVSQTELKLTKEIESVRKEIKEVELRLTQEIENTRKEIKELDLRLTQEIKESKLSTIKWVVGFLIAQTGILVGALIGFMKMMG